MSALNVKGSPDNVSKEITPLSEPDKESKESLPSEPELKPSIPDLNELDEEEVEVENEGEEEKDESSDSDNDVEEDVESVCSEITPDMKLVNVGEIDISFPENHDPKFIEEDCYPTSYFTLSAKERLTLTFAENFRRQFRTSNPHRRALVLAVKNECNIQKFVAHAIRPTTFLFSELIASLEGCTKFVSDFIIYERLTNPIGLPTRLMSPDTLLRRRRGNCFEMATLLCSMLIGAGYAALVVSGTATRRTTRSDQRDIPCPYIPQEESEDNKNVVEEDNKYKLREPPDLTSRLLAELETKPEDNLNPDDDESKKEEPIVPPKDPYWDQRTHAWVAVIENAPWCHKPKPKAYNDEGEEIQLLPTAFFLEPSTGRRHEVSSPNYLRIESMWNNYNYYVNLKEPTENGLADIYWDLGYNEHWEHFLPAEPFEMRTPEDNVDFDSDAGEDEEVPKTLILAEKHLDLIPSWVQKLRITAKDLENRYPNNEKIIFYDKAIYQVLAPFFKRDGLTKRLTLYSDEKYKNPTYRWEWYSNRSDSLDLIETDFKTKAIKESFTKGRPDCLKAYEHNVYLNSFHIFHFYYFTRSDALKTIEFYVDKTILRFEKRDDFLYYQEFSYKQKTFGILDSGILQKITEKFNRNEKLPSNKDIAVRDFILNKNTILLKFHYAHGAITASTREFLKPPKPEYGEEIVFDPSTTKGYIANPLEEPPTQVELYFLLMKQLKQEEHLKHIFEERCAEIDDILTRRKHEMYKPVLRFSVFDRSRNQGARALRIKEYEDKEREKELTRLNDADFLAPYLLPYKNRKPDIKESKAAMEACLRDVKNRYINLLNTLQRHYEDLRAEGKALRRFLDKFQDQFDDFDYERLSKEAQGIELNKRMVQQRLIILHEEAERKYQNIKESLYKDVRLTRVNT